MFWKGSVGYITKVSTLACNVGCRLKSVCEVCQRKGMFWKGSVGYITKVSTLPCNVGCRLK